MLTTITTTTVTTVVAIGQAMVTVTLGVVILIVLLIAKELLTSYADDGVGNDGRAEEVKVKNDTAAKTIKTSLLATNLNVAIYPLLFSFLLVVLMKVVEVL